MIQIGKSQQARLEIVEALLAGKSVMLVTKTDINKEISAYKNLGFDLTFEECYNGRGLDPTWFIRDEYIYIRQKESKPSGYLLKLKK